MGEGEEEKRSLHTPVSEIHSIVRASHTLVRALSIFMELDGVMIWREGFERERER
jgi:hypothetical protein